MELICVEYQRETGGRILRLYIDRPGGVTLDDCAVVSRQLGDLLDVHFDASLPYNLEVSSPGASRPLSGPSDYEKFKGRKAKIRTVEALDGQKNFKGTLTHIKDGVVTLTVMEKSVAIPFADITKARLINYSGEN